MAIKHGTVGADTLLGSLGADQLFGEAGNDLLKGKAGADTLDGGGDTDAVVYGGTARVEVSLQIGTGFSGDAEGDTYVSIENVVGSTAGDFLEGNGVGNRLDGGGGRDNLRGNAGSDTLNAGGDDDTLQGGSGFDVLNGGAGIDDIASYVSSVTGVNVNLTTGLTSGDEASGDTFIGIENLRGSEASDLLAGNGAANDLSGQGGNDKLFGLSGRDFLIGGSGADTLIGGNEGDTFFFAGTNESPTGFFVRDVINDLSHAQNDKIDLHNIDAIAATSIDDGFEFLGKDGFLDAPGQIEYVFEGNTTVVRVNTAGDGAPEMEIQLLGQINLVAGDFFL